MINKTKILLVDIETTPLLGYAFGFWETDILKTMEDSYMLCYSYKWLGEKKTHVVSLPDFKLYDKDKSNDRDLVKSLHDLFCEADIIIGHNSDQFDIKKSNVRFAFHKMKPPTPYVTVDTKKVAKRYFKFDSNKLTELGRFLGLGVKEETGGIQLWFDCMDGKEKAWKKMTSYNIQDVVLLEKIYLELLPWITNHPLRTMMSPNDSTCKNCLGSHMTRQGYKMTRTGKKQQMKCADCGAWDTINLDK